MGTNLPKEVKNTVTLILQQYGVNFGELLSNASNDQEKHEGKAAWITIKDASRHASVSRYTIARWIKKERFKTRKPNPAKSGKVLISLESLDDFIESCSSNSNGGVSA